MGHSIPVDDGPFWNFGMGIAKVWQIDFLDDAILK